MDNFLNIEKLLTTKNINNLNETDVHQIFNSVVFSEDIDIEDNSRSKSSKSSKSKDRCVNCDTDENLIEDTQQGNLVCNQCGQIVRRLFDYGLETRSYADDGGNGDNARCSMPINKLLPQSSLGTQINSNRKWKSKVHILQEWITMPYKERSLHKVFKDIHDKCNKAGLYKCIEDDAKIMYKTISDNNHNNKSEFEEENKEEQKKGKRSNIIIRGLNRKSLIAACVFFACKRRNMSRSPKEIAKMFGMEDNEVIRGCKNMAKLMEKKSTDVNIGTSRPEEFIRRFCNELKLRTFYADCAENICKNIQKLNIVSNHTPQSIATAGILLMAEINNLDINKKKISQIFHISEVTIGKTYKKIEKYKKILVDSKKTNTIQKEIELNNDSVEIPDHLLEKFKKFNIPTCDINIGVKKDMKLDIKSIDNKHKNILNEYYNLNGE